MSVRLAGRIIIIVLSTGVLLWPLSNSGYVVHIYFLSPSFPLSLSLFLYPSQTPPTHIYIYIYIYIYTISLSHSYYLFHYIYISISYSFSLAPVSSLIHICSLSHSHYHALTTFLLSSYISFFFSLSLSSLISFSLSSLISFSLSLNIFLSLGIFSLSLSLSLSFTLFLSFFLCFSLLSVHLPNAFLLLFTLLTSDAQLDWLFIQQPLDDLCKSHFYQFLRANCLHPLKCYRHFLSYEKISVNNASDLFPRQL